MASDTPLSASLEDYLEVIGDELKSKPAVRAKDVAARLAVRPASVTGALRQLTARGLVLHERYGYITLTERGRTAAASVAGRHGLLQDFFMRILGAPAAEAEVAACGLEHALPPRMQERLVQFVKFLDACPHGGNGWRDHFQCFLQHGRLPDSCAACAAARASAAGGPPARLGSGRRNRAIPG
jgi:DtxR family Mn-dependent transcriptional regulator